MTHRRIQGDVVEKLAKVAKGASIEQLLIASHPAWKRNIDLGGNQYLAQCKSNPLAQLILTIEGVGEEMALELVVCVVVSLAVSGAACGTCLRPKRQFRIIRDWRRHLFIQKCLKAGLLHAGDKLGRRTECGLFKETYRVRRGWLCFNHSHHSGCGSQRKGKAIRTLSETAGKNWFSRCNLLQCIAAKMMPKCNGSDKK